MPTHTGTRLGPWGQLYHWELINGKLVFVNGIEPQSGIEFSSELPDAVD